MKPSYNLKLNVSYSDYIHKDTKRGNFVYRLTRVTRGNPDRRKIKNIYMIRKQAIPRVKLSYLMARLKFTLKQRLKYAW